MKITNRSHLPASVVKLVSFGDRPAETGRISVTTLLRPPQQVALQRKHEDEITEDAADRIWAVYGTLMHLAIERIGHDNALTEEKLSTELEGWTLHGTPDLYADEVVSDFKFVSVWSAIEGVKPEWTQQLNAYAYLLELHGFPVRKLQVVALYRDWSKSKANETQYPSAQAEVLPVPLWSPFVIRDFLSRRMRQHIDAELGVPIDCTPEERWEKPTVYAVTKKDAKRATKLCDSRQEAEDFADGVKPGMWNRWFDIIERPGLSVRCESYCAVRDFCPQYARAKEAIAV